MFSAKRSTCLVKTYLVKTRLVKKRHNGAVQKRTKKATPRYRPYLSSADRALGTEPFPCSSDREQSKAHGRPTGRLARCRRGRRARRRRSGSRSRRSTSPSGTVVHPAWPPARPEGADGVRQGAGGDSQRQRPRGAGEGAARERGELGGRTEDPPNDHRNGQERVCDAAKTGKHNRLRDKHGRQSPTPRQKSA